MISVLVQAALILSILLFFFGLFTRQPAALVFSAVLFLPMSYYFFGANNAFRLLALLPLLPLLLAYFLRHQERGMVE